MRRIRVPEVRIGQVSLDPRQAHHLRDVLRMRAGDAVEAFDETGLIGSAIIEECGPGGVSLLISEVNRPPDSRWHWTVASAIPKGDRADWMVEKLSELGADEFIPLQTTRAVVLPQGKSKIDRWHRLAEESARQSGRPGIMRIGNLQPLATLLDHFTNQSPQSLGYFCSFSANSRPIADALADARLSAQRHLLLLIGPEGGWTPDEESQMSTARLTPVRLGDTILRIETAAVAAGAVVSALLSQPEPRDP